MTIQKSGINKPSFFIQARHDAQLGDQGYFGSLQGRAIPVSTWAPLTALHSGSGPRFQQRLIHVFNHDFRVQLEIIFSQ